MNKSKMLSITTAVMAAVSLLITGCADNKSLSSGSDTSATQAPVETSAEHLSANGITTSDDGSIRAELTAVELSRIMGNGINLGNTMEAYDGTRADVNKDATDFEILWGQPITTQEAVDGMKAAGFDTIRIPIAWTNSMDFENGSYTISESYFNRVEEIINYALNADMHVIINDHWDGGWWGMFGSATPSVREKAMEMYKSMWTQIAERYKEYSDRLIFEGGNEEIGNRLNDKDKAPDSGALSVDECYETANLINQTFVDIVRSTGGNNENRFLLIPGYDTIFERTLDERFVMPTDTAKNKLLLSLHYYDPSGYCIGASTDNWGIIKDYEDQNASFESISRFVDEGYGIIIGEYGVLKAENYTARPNTDIYITNLLNNCDLYGYVPMLWDTSTLYNRIQNEMPDEAAANIFKDRNYESEKDKTEDEIKTAAKASLDAALASAPEMFPLGDDVIIGDDNTAVAWIMYNSQDYSVSYSVGDVYDPSKITNGVVTNNVIIEEAGTYTVGLDFTALKSAPKGITFSALGISNGEILFPGYLITIDEIKINGETFTAENDYYTCSDDGKCTRVNFYNAWVTAVPEEARIAGGDLSNASATNLNLSGDFEISTIEVTFTYAPPAE